MLKPDLSPKSAPSSEGQATGANSTVIFRDGSVTPGFNFQTEKHH